MPLFTAKVDATHLNLALDKLPDALRERLRATIQTLTDELLAEVKANEPRRTGRLQADTRSFVDVSEGWVRGRVRILRSGSAANIGEAAGALEYGAPGRRGAFRVRTYTRRMTQVFGHPVQAQEIIVHSYQRKAHIRARRFLRDPAAAMLPRARAALEAAVTEAIKDAQK